MKEEISKKQLYNFIRNMNTIQEGLDKVNNKIDKEAEQ